MPSDKGKTPTQDQPRRAAVSSFRVAKRERNKRSISHSQRSPSPSRSRHFSLPLRPTYQQTTFPAGNQRNYTEKPEHKTTATGSDADSIGTDIYGTTSDDTKRPRYSKPKNKNHSCGAMRQQIEGQDNTSSPTGEKPSESVGSTETEAFLSSASAHHANAKNLSEFFRPTATIGPAADSKVTKDEKHDGTNENPNHTDKNPVRPDEESVTADKKGFISAAAHRRKQIKRGGQKTKKAKAKKKAALAHASAPGDHNLNDEAGSVASASRTSKLEESLAKVRRHACIERGEKELYEMMSQIAQYNPAYMSGDSLRQEIHKSVVSLYDKEGFLHSPSTEHRKQKVCDVFWAVYDKTFQPPPGSDPTIKSTVIELTDDFKRILAQYFNAFGIMKASEVEPSASRGPESKETKPTVTIPGEDFALKLQPTSTHIGTMKVSEVEPSEPREPESKKIKPTKSQEPKSKGIKPTQSREPESKDETPIERLEDLIRAVEERCAQIEAMKASDVVPSEPKELAAFLVRNYFERELLVFGKDTADAGKTILAYALNRDFSESSKWSKTYRAQRIKIAQLVKDLESERRVSRYTRKVADENTKLSFRNAELEAEAHVLKETLAGVLRETDALRVQLGLPPTSLIEKTGDAQRTALRVLLNKVQLDSTDLRNILDDLEASFAMLRIVVDKAKASGFRPPAINK